MFPLHIRGCNPAVFSGIAWGRDPENTLRSNAPHFLSFYLCVSLGPIQSYYLYICSTIRSPTFLFLCHVYIFYFIIFFVININKSCKFKKIHIHVSLSFLDEPNIRMIHFETVIKIKIFKFNTCKAVKNNLNCQKLLIKHFKIVGTFQ